MATVSYIQEHHQSPAAMKAVIDYCGQDKKVYDENTNRRLVSGVNCDGENAYKEFMATKRAYQKSTGWSTAAVNRISLTICPRSVTR